MAVRVWADVYRNGVKQNPGPVWAVRSAQATRRLDGAGSITIEAPGTDPRANQLLQNDDTIYVYVDQGDGAREIGRGIIRRVDFDDTASGWTISADGPDELAELKDASVLLNRQYTEQTIQAVASALVGLADGWTASVDASVASNLITTRFDGVSVLKALQYMCDQTGLHLRQAADSKTVEIGPFGESNGLRIVAGDHLSGDHNPDVALMASRSGQSNSEQLVNWLIPLGGGEGEAALTLENSTRSSPYTIQSTTGPDGQTLWYIATGETPVRQHVGTFKDISPIANSDAAKELAANALYDAAAAWLERNSVEQETYRVSVKGCRTTVRPGDKVHLTYQGVIETEDEGVFKYRDIDADFWVIEAVEGAGEGGVSLALEISNIDKVQMDAAEIIVGALAELELRNLKPMLYPFLSREVAYDHVQGASTLADYDTFPYYKEARFRVVVDESFHSLTRVNVRFRTLPLASTSLWNDALGVNLHAAYESGLYPSDIYLYIDGVNVTTDFGGPWNPSANNQVDVTLDVSSYFQGENLQGVKEFQFRCLSRITNEPSVIPYFGGTSVEGSRGTIEFTQLLLGTCQAILVD